MIGLLLQILLYPPFLLLRLLLHSIRDAVWWANGTRGALLRNEEKEHYESSVHVLSVWGRRKLDNIGCCNFLSDFILFHEGFEHPRYLLRSEISLYCITPREFVFIQCAEGDTAWNVRDFSFSREGQFKKAKRVLVVPIQTAHHLAEEMGGRPKEKLIFITNTARCGSTLACQIFQESGKCVAYSEPNPIADLLKYATKPNDPTAARLVASTLTLLCKPAAHPVVAHVLKVQPYQTGLVPALSEHCTEASYLFLYRNIQPTCSSFIKLFTSLPVGILAGLTKCIHLRLWFHFLTNHGILNPYQPFTLPEIFSKPKGFYAEVSLTPLLAIREYLALCRRGYYVGAVRYEDLLSDPAGNVKQIFEFCGLSTDLVKPAVRAFETDAQSGSPISRDKVKHLHLGPFSENDAREIRQLCLALQVPNIVEDHILPGTISRQKKIAD